MRKDDTFGNMLAL